MLHKGTVVLGGQISTADAHTAVGQHNPVGADIVNVGRTRLEVEKVVEASRRDATAIHNHLEGDGQVGTVHTGRALTRGVAPIGAGGRLAKKQVGGGVPC